MTRIRIEATDAGFFNTGPTGLALAPNVFLATRVNGDGRIEDRGAGWFSQESYAYADFGISADVAGFDGGSAALGTQAGISLTGLGYFRMEAGQMLATGTLTLPAPLQITATYDRLGVDSFGWRADAGAALADMLRHNGFAFRGGEGGDVFAAHQDILPYYTFNVLRGFGGDDTLTGSLGDDRIWGGTGNDRLFDPDGSNRIFAGRGDDYVELGSGSDASFAKGGSGSDTLVSGLGNDRLHGGAGRDTLLGGGGQDLLEGARGNDRLDGGSGDDRLEGGRGSDILSGGDGADVFVFRATERGRDHITDFTPGEDRLEFQGLTLEDLEISARGTDTVIVWDTPDGHASVTLDDMAPAYVDNGDFLFV